MSEYITHSREETVALGRKLAAVLPDGALIAFSVIAVLVFTAILLWLPNDRYARRIGRGAAMSYPSGASQPTGASILAATSPRRKRLSWKDSRIRSWIFAGIAAGHAQAATLTCIGFFVIDRLNLEPHGSESSIAIVMMAGASATLAAQWGIIPRLNMSPRALISAMLSMRAAAKASASAIVTATGTVCAFSLRA